MSNPAPVMPEKPVDFTGIILRGGAAGAAGLTLFAFAWLLLAALFTGRMDGQTAMAFPVKRAASRSHANTNSVRPAAPAAPPRRIMPVKPPGFSGITGAGSLMPSFPPSRARRRP
ncbi:MAG TPA: hypothetical protein VM490_13215, partial [Armatimonadaceae bacterium]|nr:hypothetical protein [Armatimonadaceae bacterium]